MAYLVSKTCLKPEKLTDGSGKLNDPDRLSANRYRVGTVGGRILQIFCARPDFKLIRIWKGDMEYLHIYAQCLDVDD